MIIINNSILIYTSRSHDLRQGTGVYSYWRSRCHNQRIRIACTQLQLALHHHQTTILGKIHSTSDRRRIFQQRYGADGAPVSRVLELLCLGLMSVVRCVAQDTQADMPYKPSSASASHPCSATCLTRPVALAICRAVPCGGTEAAGSRFARRHSRVPRGAQVRQEGGHGLRHQHLLRPLRRDGL